MGIKQGSDHRILVVGDKLQCWDGDIIAESKIEDHTLQKDDNPFKSDIAYEHIAEVLLDDDKVTVRIKARSRKYHMSDKDAEKTSTKKKKFLFGDKFQCYRFLKMLEDTKAVNRAAYTSLDAAVKKAAPWAGTRRLLDLQDCLERE